ncbi:MAG: hypothetical protein RL059_555 [Bacteroidota bacterium]|jgi:hypothetical protein
MVFSVEHENMSREMEQIFLTIFYPKEFKTFPWHIGCLRKHYLLKIMAYMVNWNRTLFWNKSKSYKAKGNLQNN